MHSANENYFESGHIATYHQTWNSAPLVINIPSKWKLNKITGIKILDFVSSMQSTDSSKIIYIKAKYVDSAGSYPFYAKYDKTGTELHNNIAYCLFNSALGRHVLHGNNGVCAPKIERYVKKEGTDYIEIDFEYEGVGGRVNFQNMDYFLKFEVHFGPQPKYL